MAQVCITCYQETVHPSAQLATHTHQNNDVVSLGAEARCCSQAEARLSGLSQEEVQLQTALQALSKQKVLPKTTQRRTGDFL